MKPDFERFLYFLKSFPNLNNSQVNNLHKALFRTPKVEYINCRTLASICNTNIYKAYEILNRLHETKVIHIEPLICKNCGNQIDYNRIRKKNLRCTECESAFDMSEDIFFIVDGILNTDEKNRLKEWGVAHRNAENLAEIWKKNKFITYMLLDLVQSQKIQAQGDDEYYRFLEVIRKDIIINSISQIKNDYCLLGEIGDCFKIAFAEIDDAVKMLIEFSRQLTANKSYASFYSIHNKINNFPRFKVVIEDVSLPLDIHGNIISPRQLIFTTLSGSIDINTAKLTELFRIDSAIKMKIKKDYEYNISLWLLSNAVSHCYLRENIKNTTIIKAIKNNLVVAESEAALVLLHNGEMEIPDNPDEYLLNSNT